jgi:hypothetical protein
MPQDFQQVAHTISHSPRAQGKEGGKIFSLQMLNIYNNKKPDPEGVCRESWSFNPEEPQGAETHVEISG